MTSIPIFKKVSMKYILSITLFLTLFSCKKDEFNGNLKSIYDAYNPNDTLIFKSIKTGEIIKYVITNKKNNIYNLPRSLQSRESSAFVYYKDLTNNSKEIQLLQITSFYYNLYVTFGDFGKLFSGNFGTVNNTDTIIALNKKIIDYYTLYDDQPATNQKIITIIWQQKYGIVKYDLVDSNSYVRINIP
jgi:hypothetical protein